MTVAFNLICKRTVVNNRIVGMSILLIASVQTVVLLLYYVLYNFHDAGCIVHACPYCDTTELLIVNTPGYCGIDSVPVCLSVWPFGSAFL